VDSFMAVTRLNQAETAQAVAFAMVPGSTADLWLENLLESHPDDVATWALMRPLLLARFSPTLTASEKAAMVDNCKQTRTEDVQAFMDKCESTQILLERHIPDAQRIDAFAAAFNANHAAGVLGLFLRGLREEQGLKSHVNGANADNLADYLAEANRFERHVTKQIKVIVAEIAEDEGDHDDADEGDAEDGDEVASLKPRMGQKKKTFGQGGRGGGFGRGGRGGGFRGRGGGRGRPNRGGGGGGGDRPPLLCWTCNSSSHLNAACPQNRGKGGGGGRGGYRPGGSSGAPQHQAMLMQINSLQNQLLNMRQDGGGGGGNVEAVDFNCPPYQQEQQHGQKDFW
jgi:hypothetical protein